MLNKSIICSVGLGYVGLPLAVAFGKAGFRVIGYDINQNRIKTLKQGIDWNNECSQKELNESKIEFTSDPHLIKKADFIIVGMPTPITSDKKPNLSALEKASKTIGTNLKEGAIVIYESTVYPGVTEEICKPILEARAGFNVKVAYSPERINPGDKNHTITKIKKIVATEDKDTLDKVASLYKTITKVYKVQSIKVAEAAKVIENIQRDINIALINECSIIFNKIGISTKEVLKAAETKWNWNKFYPGLVGGHCISIDPYYLVHKSREIGYEPSLLTAGRNINEYMPIFIAQKISRELKKINKKIIDAKILVMGLAFKENVNDTRNIKIPTIFNHMRNPKNIYGFDPLLEDGIIEKLGFQIYNDEKVDVIIYAINHDVFRNVTLNHLKNKCNKDPILFDIKMRFDKQEAEKKGFIYLSL